MQKRKKLFHSDASKISVTFLQSRARKYLREIHNVQDSWAPDYFEEHRDEKYDEVLDVILLGDFFNKFIMSGIWPFEQYRFWVLSNRVKMVMVNVVGFDTREISVIPREKVNVDSRIDLETIKRFVYVGQIREEKNLLISLYLVFLLQQKGNKKIPFEIYGDFFLEDKDPERIKYKELIISIVNDSGWLLSPKLMGYRQEVSYEKNDCYLNLSTYCFEDFSLSTEEADKQNVTKIISGWGGIFESEKKNSFYVPQDLIGRNNTSKFESYLKAKSILKILGNQFNYKENEIFQDTLPQVVSRKRLDDIRKNFIKAYGQSFYLGYKNFDSAIDSNKAQMFLSLYEENFSGLQYEPTELMIVSDLDLLSEDAQVRIEKNISNELVFVHMANLKYKTYQTKIIKAKKVYCPLEYESFDTIKTISSLIGTSLVFI